jgi:hypothetical protein
MILHPGASVGRNRKGRRREGQADSLRGVRCRDRSEVYGTPEEVLRAVWCDGR